MKVTQEVLAPLLNQLCDVAIESKQDIVNLGVQFDGDENRVGVEARLILAVGPAAVHAMDTAVQFVDAIRGHEKVLASNE